MSTIPDSFLGHFSVQRDHGTASQVSHRESVDGPIRSD
jgi:hypothetical protein